MTETPLLISQRYCLSNADSSSLSYLFIYLSVALLLFKCMEPGKHMIDKKPWQSKVSLGFLIVAEDH